MPNELNIKKVGNRTICIGGLGKLFYQDGLPIGISAQLLKNEGIETSFYHVADELLKHGWSSDTVISKMTEEMQDDLNVDNTQIGEIISFCNADYKEQREMIFKFLFGITPDEMSERLKVNN